MWCMRRVGRCEVTLSLTSPFDLADPRLPVIAEPLYLQANARITVSPRLALEDIKEGVEEAPHRMPAPDTRTRQGWERRRGVDNPV